MCVLYFTNTLCIICSTEYKNITENLKKNISNRKTVKSLPPESQSIDRYSAPMCYGIENYINYPIKTKICSSNSVLNMCTNNILQFYYKKIT